jgi:anaerobic selenocysteine-containing dehydrogenase
MPLCINPVDAEARGIEDGDTVRVFNDRGHYICGAWVTERQKPGVVWTYEGGWYSPKEPGNADSLDLGGNVNTVCYPRQASKICDGMMAGSALVEVERWEE